LGDAGAAQQFELDLLHRRLSEKKIVPEDLRCFDRQRKGKKV